MSNRFIGFYNVSVILTYIGLGFSLTGMSLALRGHLKIAIVCLMVSGLCDMFDGKIASMVKRSSSAKMFGVQIDSLCDLVCFGVFPAVILYSFGKHSWYWIAIAIMYVLAAVIRLGYYNVTEIERISTTGSSRKYLLGLPVTTASIIFPTVFALQRPVKALLEGFDYSIVYGIVMFIVALLFVLNFKVRKAGSFGMVIMTLVGAAIFVGVLLG